MRTKFALLTLPNFAWRTIVLEGVIQQIRTAEPDMLSRRSTSRQLSPEAFDELFLATYPRLVSILRRMLGNSGRAEEIANEAFLKLHSSTLPPSASENIPGWLYRTAMHLGIDDLRARSRHSRLEQAAVQSAPIHRNEEDGLQILLRLERQQRVRAVLAKLNPKWAQLLLLRATGYSYRELAEHLQIPSASIGTMLIRAEAAFEKQFLELFGENSQEGL